MKFGMTDSLLEQLYSIHTLQQEYIQKRLKKIGLTIQQARTLNYIATHAGTIQRNVAAYLGKQDATVTNLLKTLEKQEYIIRKIPDDNERQKKLYLTAKGTTIVKKVQAIFIDLEGQLSTILSEKNKNTLRQSLKILEQQFPE